MRLLFGGHGLGDGSWTHHDDVDGFRTSTCALYVSNPIMRLLAESNPIKNDIKLAASNRDKRSLGISSIPIQLSIITKRPPIPKITPPLKKRRKRKKSKEAKKAVPFNETQSKKKDERKTERKSAQMPRGGLVCCLVVARSVVVWVAAAMA